MKNLLLALMILTSANSVPAFAETSVALNAGDKAPFTGVLLTNELANDLNRAVIERDSLRAQNLSLNTIVKLQDDSFLHQQKKVSILLEQNDRLAISLGKERSMSTWERVAWTSLGVIATGVAAYGLKKVTQ